MVWGCAGAPKAVRLLVPGFGAGRGGLLLELDATGCVTLGGGDVVRNQFIGLSWCITPDDLFVGTGLAGMVTGFSSEMDALDVFASADDDSPELSEDELALDGLRVLGTGRCGCGALVVAEATVPDICRSRSLAMALTWSQSGRCGVKAR